MNNAWLSLGSNEGDRLQWIQQAIDLLFVNFGPIVKKSAIYETAAWGLTAQPDFLNMALQLQTGKAPAALLTEIHKIETTLGRQREVKWAQRTLDIDILLYNDEIIELPGLVIPHPFIQDRRFTLTPLAEIAPEYVHPKLNKTILQLLSECPDQLGVHKFSCT
jgi:2-amino-4-hydroxy-6-hydroxymethyldihydropteridine diphosphokinase